MRSTSKQALILLAAGLQILPAAATAPPHVLKRLDARIPMRDGVRLAANIFRPDPRARVPTILIRTPYSKGNELSASHHPFVERGYAVVVQDVRGRYASEGAFRPLDQEPEDGYDTLSWIASQPWSNGRIGMMGGSYVGIVQWKVAVLNHPNLRAISPVVSGSDDYRDRFYSPGGALKLGHRLLWMRENLRAHNYQPPDFNRFVLHIPLRTIDRFTTGQTSEMLQRVLDHPSYDGFWQSVSVRGKLSGLRVPVLAFGGWFDNFVEGDLEAFAAQPATSPYRLVVGAWPHNMSIPFDGIDYGPSAAQPVRTMQIEWFDHWLKDSPAPLPAGPRLKIFVMGANRWREESGWPLAHARVTPYYLHAHSGAGSLSGDGTLSLRRPRREAPDRFVYDPRNPVPTSGGAVCCNPKIFPWGPLDQRTVEQRRDVLVYTSQPLSHDLEVTGPIRVVAWASTSAPDTDFTAKLVDVFPDGAARSLTDGILRLRYRDSLEKPALANPGEIYRLTINAGVTSNLFAQGHRIRLEISSSNFPRFDRNPNTGRAIADEIGFHAASQTVYHDRLHPSHFLLPVVR
ncbi:MAG: CocE/NonD family hydrolase [Bryobacteraceae bacterium]